MDKRIEAFLDNELSATELEQFERELKEDPILARELAFFLSVKNLSKEKGRQERLADRHQEWQSQSTAVRVFRPWMAAAALVLLIGLGWWLVLLNSNSSLQSYSSQYVSDHFNSISVQMNADSKKDSLQLAIEAFNKGDYQLTLDITGHLLERDPANPEALETGGIAAIRLKDYQKAIALFNRLGDQTNLYANPGKFYEAVARVEEGSADNLKRAEDLLIEVVNQDLEGAKEAQKWLKK